MTATRFVSVVAIVVVAATLAARGTRWWTAEAAEQGGAAFPDGEQPVASLMAKSRGFRELLAAIQSRTAELDRRESELTARETSFQALRRTVVAETARLEGLAKQLGADPASPRSAGVAIAKVYESMRPEEAAPILDRLDDTTLRAVLGRMREKQVGAILAAMSPDRAVAFTKALAPATGATPRSPAP